MQPPSSVCKEGVSQLWSRGGLCHAENNVPGLLCLFEQSYLRLLREFTLCKLNFGPKSHGHVPEAIKQHKAKQV